VDGVNRIVDVLTERRGAELTAGIHCRWCLKKSDCTAHAAMLAMAELESAVLTPTRAAQPAPVPVPVTVGGPSPATATVDEPDPYLLD
jgi:hypothetical protein